MTGERLVASATSKLETQNQCHLTKFELKKRLTNTAPPFSILRVPREPNQNATHDDETIPHSVTDEIDERSVSSAHTATLGSAEPRVASAHEQAPRRAHSAVDLSLHQLVPAGSNVAVGHDGNR